MANSSKEQVRAEPAAPACHEMSEKGPVHCLPALCELEIAFNDTYPCDRGAWTIVTQDL